MDAFQPIRQPGESPSISALRSPLDTFNTFCSGLERPIHDNEFFQTQESQRLLPATVAPFALHTNGLDSHAIRSLFTSPDRALLIGPRTADTLMQSLADLVPAFPSFQCVVTITESELEMVIPALLSEQLQGMIPDSICTLLAQDIIAESRSFFRMTNQPAIGLRLLSESNALIESMRDDFSIVDLETATLEVKANIEYIGYAGAFIYHKDDYGINLIRSYAGPTTLCFAPNALTVPEGLALMENWITHFFDEQGLAVEVLKQLSAGERTKAKHTFELLLQEVWKHQIYLEGSGNTLAQPYTFPFGRSAVYFGDQTHLEPFGTDLLFHARPLCYLARPESKRFALMLETLQGHDVTNIFS